MNKILMGLGLIAGLASLEAGAVETRSVTLENGAKVQLEQAACYNPETGRLEPCFIQVQAQAAPEAAADACIDPVTHRPEPCF